MSAHVLEELYEALSVSDEVLYSAANEILILHNLDSSLYSGDLLECLKKTINDTIVPTIKRAWNASKNSGQSMFDAAELRAMLLEYEALEATTKAGKLIGGFFKEIQNEGFAGATTARVVILVAAVDALTKLNQASSGLDDVTLSRSEWLMIVLAAMRLNCDLPWKKD